MKPHFAKPTLVTDESRRGIKLVAEPICRICGLPIERTAKHAAPGAWRHVKEERCKPRN